LDYGSVVGMRFLSWLLSLAIIALLVCGLLLYWGGADYLSRYLTEMLGTLTVVHGLAANTHSISLKGLEVSNPVGSKVAHAFKANAIILDAPFSTYLHKTIHLNELKIDSPTLGIELYNSSGSSNNWSHLLKSLPLSSGGERHFIIDRLVITNIQFDALKANGKRISIPTIPYLEFRNLGSDHPLTTSELSRIIFQSLLSIVAKEAALSKILNNVVPLSKAIIDRAPIDDKTRGRIEKAERFIDGLFDNY